MYLNHLLFWLSKTHTITIVMHDSSKKQDGTIIAMKKWLTDIGANVAICSQWETSVDNIFLIISSSNSFAHPNKSFLKTMFFVIIDELNF